jgi:hypothetical protein
MEVADAQGLQTHQRLDPNLCLRVGSRTRASMLVMWVLLMSLGRR